MVLQRYGAAALAFLTLGLGPMSAHSEEGAQALSYMRSQGVSLVDIGADCGGLAASLGQKDGKLQTFYVSPDGTHVVAGVCFRAGGVNVTGLQLERLAKATTSPSLLQPAPATLETTGEAAVEKPAASAAADPGPAPQQIPGTPAMLADAEAAAWFPVGAKEAPIVFMVADPRCGHCHSTWQVIAPAVYEGKVQVRIILVGMLGLESEADAKAILALQNPAMAWLGGVGSGTRPAPALDKKALTAAEGYLARNDAFRRKHQIGGTPFLIYKDKEGEIRTRFGGLGAADATAILAEM